MMADKLSRAERRARIFPRAPQPKAAPAPGPNPAAMRSGIRPLKDEYEALMELGESHGNVPFASKDEDLTKPSGIADSTIAYIATFDKQRCERCGSYTNVFHQLFELHNSGKETPTPRLPAISELPIRSRATGSIQYVPVGACCAFKGATP